MKNVNKQAALTWLIPAVAGLILIIFARGLTSAIEAILGIGLILAGASGIAGWWKERGTRRESSIVMLIGAVLGMALGIWILTHLHAFDNLLNYVIGGVMIFIGLQWFFMNREGLGLNVVTLLSAALVILGVFVILHKGATTLPIRFAGAALIISSLCAALGPQE